MRFTLAFDIFNKQKWIESILDTWLGHLSGEHSYEVILVFDDPKDASETVARRAIQTKYSHIPCTYLHAANEYEIFCNQLAADQARGDWIVFIQDDNWMYDRGWDDTLARVITLWQARLGMVGLLAGGNVHTVFQWDRVECQRPHKDEIPNPFPLAVWDTNLVCRPFAVNVQQLRSMGGLDFDYRPTMFDDIDLSLRMLQAKYRNLYIPFDIVNTVASNTTMGRVLIERLWQENNRVCLHKNEGIIRRATHYPPRQQLSVKVVRGGIRLG